jgi:hypothetical protein
MSGVWRKAQGNCETSEAGETMKNIIVENLDAIVFRLAELSALRYARTY